MFDAPKILIIDEDLAVCSSVKLLLKRQDYEVDSISYSRSALKQIERFAPDLVLMNVEFEISVVEVLSILGKKPLILMTDLENLPKAVEGIKLGAIAYISKAFSEIKLVSMIQSYLSLQLPASEELSRMERMSFRHLIGNDPVFLDVLSRLKMVAKSGANVLIEGETGTGKTLVAETILKESKESASTSKFLFNVDEMPLAKQGQFSIELFNSTNQLRVISTTKKAIDDLIAKGDFREDLFYQLNSVQLSMPSLKERVEDIPLLASYFLDNLKQLFKRSELRIDGFAMHWLKQQTFSGNIRQLKKLVERTALSSFDDKITAEAFKLEFQNSINNTPVFIPEIGELTAEQLEILMMKQAQTIHKGDRLAATRLLGWSNNSFLQKIKKYGIE